MRADLVFASWLRTRWAMRLASDALAAHRQRLWAKLQPALTRTPALAAFAGKPIADFPITEINDVRADYGAWNSLGMSDTALRALADAAESGIATGDLSAGWSSGTGGGQRGLFVTAPAERADYIGQTLARLLPARALLRRQRIALHLRASNPLYSESRNGRFVFAHFPLETGIDDSLTAFTQFDPTILIAPPHRLLEFAHSGTGLPSLRHLFCGSEPISPAECDFVAERIGLRPRSIYQATEGFLGGECSAGRLHLNDHALDIELEPVAGTTGFRPVITDLRRTSQPVVRVRGDDYLEPGPPDCPCGFAGRVIHPPQGRVGDIWRFVDRTVTPPQVVAAVEGVLGGGQSWQAVASVKSVTLRVPPGSIGAKQAAAMLETICRQPVRIDPNLGAWPGPKRRKLVWHHG